MSTREKRDARVSAGTRRTLVSVLIGVVVLAVGALAAWKICASREAPAADRLSLDAQKLIGRWRRTDTPYVIEIQSAGDEGTLQATYYNPRPINVSVAEARDNNGELELFVELRDVGYPGSTYTLNYNKERDLLYGVYFQAAMGQRYNVAFMRAPAETEKER
jgi:hypothetical protein